MRQFIGAAVAAVFLLGGCAQDVLNTEPEVRGLEGAAPLQTLVDPRSGTDVTLLPGGKLRVELDSNMTTGYFWILTAMDETSLRLLSEDYTSDPAPAGMTGVGGTMVFEFEGVAKGNSTIELSHQRSLEDVAQTLSLNIKVVE